MEQEQKTMQSEKETLETTAQAQPVENPAPQQPDAPKKEPHYVDLGVLKCHGSAFGKVNLGNEQPPPQDGGQAQVLQMSALANRIAAEGAKPSEPQPERFTMTDTAMVLGVLIELYKALGFELLADLNFLTKFAYDPEGLRGAPEPGFPDGRPLTFVGRIGRIVIDLDLTNKKIWTDGAKKARKQLARLGLLISDDVFAKMLLEGPNPPKTDTK